MCFKGMNGEPGLAGAKGFPGKPGLPGPPGRKGESGDQGPTGLTGSKGSKGSKGTYSYSLGGNYIPLNFGAVFNKKFLTDDKVLRELQGLQAISPC